ncbi:hypothetical protein LBMAG42_24310 [Deltaproteobacteria bacterium]|nr:hypothetical protein LBMAG42_24310 [Deltaproteobacteria bacterium]
MLLALFTPAAFALPLLVERFDAEPQYWDERVAEGKGGPSSKYEIGGGVITFTADERTKKFVAYGHRVALRGVEWLDVSAKVTIAGLKNPDGTDLCGAFIRFDTGLVVPTRGCEARADSAPHRRYIPVPPTSRDMEVGVALTTAGTVTVDDLVVDTTPPDLKTLVRGGFQYHWIGNDAFREEQLEQNDLKLAELSSFFGTKPGGKLEYWKYPDSATLEMFTGLRRDYIASGTRIDTVLRNDTRALVAALSRSWGDPPAMLFEGLSVHLAGDWDGRDPKLSTRTQVNEGTAPTLLTLLDPAKFAAEPPERAYTQAGAFVSWIVATKGAPAVQACFAGTGKTKTVEQNQAAIEAALGAPLSKIEAEFRASL